MEFGLDKCTKVTFKKETLVKFKVITLDINTEITELVHNNTDKYLGINYANGINHIMNKEEIIKEFYRTLSAILSTE